MWQVDKYVCDKTLVETQIDKINSSSHCQIVISFNDKIVKQMKDQFKELQEHNTSDDTGEEGIIKILSPSRNRHDN